MLCGRIYSVLGRAQHKHCPENTGSHAGTQVDKSKTIRMVAFNFLSVALIHGGFRVGQRGSREHSVLVFKKYLYFLSLFFFFNGFIKYLLVSFLFLTLTQTEGNLP